MELSMLRSGSVSLLATVSNISFIPAEASWASMYDGNGAYVYKRSDRTVYAVDSAGGMQARAALPGNPDYAGLRPSLYKSNTLLVTTRAPAPGKKPDDLGPSTYTLLELAASGSAVPRVSKKLDGFRALEIVGELPNGDMVYCECTREGGEGITGTLYLWKVATKKTEALREFSAQNIGVLHGSSVVIFADRVQKSDLITLVAYDIPTRKQKTLWRFPGVAEWGYVSFDHFAHRALAFSQTGAYVVSLDDGSTAFSWKQPAGEKPVLPAIMYPLPPEQGVHYAGLGYIDGGAQWGIIRLRDDGFHTQPLPFQSPRYEPIDYVNSGTLLLRRALK